MFGVNEFVWEENAGAKLRDQPDCDDVCFQEHHSNDCSRHKRKKPRMTWFPFVEKTIKKGTWMNQLLIRSKECCWVFKSSFSKELYFFRCSNCDFETKYRVFLKKFFHKREEKMQEKMKMTKQKGENLSQVQQQGSVYLCIKAISNHDFFGWYGLWNV